jgi:hypothetical protein
MMMWGTTRAVSGIAILLIVACLFDKKRQKRCAKYVIVAVLAGIYQILSYFLKYEEPFIAVTIEYILYASNVLAVMLIVIVKDERLKELFAGIVAPGLLAMYTLYMASYAGFGGVSAASCMAAVGSMLVIMIVLQKYLTKDNVRNVWEKVAGVLLSIFVFMEIILMAVFKFTLANNFDNNGDLITTLNAKINVGVAKGIICTQEHYDRYMAIYEDTEAIRNMPEDTKVIYKGDTMLWMSGNQICASYTTFYSMTKIYAETLQKYYTVHPDKIADVVYVYGKSGSDEEELVEKLAVMFGYTVKIVNTGWILSK